MVEHNVMTVESTRELPVGPPVTADEEVESLEPVRKEEARLGAGRIVMVSVQLGFEHQKM